jgi:protein ImuB
MKRVISLWLPRFATDRLSRAARPRAKAPFALVLEHRAALGLYAVNQAAEQAGLRPGMALADARAMMPALRIAPATPREDAAALARLADWCGRYSPWTAAGRPDTDPYGGNPAAAGGDPFQSLEGGGGAGLWLNATGCAHLFGGEDAMLDDLVTRVRGLGFSARAAMADTPGCAWAIARFSPGGAAWMTVPPGGAAAALAPLPVAALRLGPAIAAGLHGLGLRRVADLADLPRAPLAVRFGEKVMARLDTALGRRAETLSPERHRPPLAARLAFPEPLGRTEDIAAALDVLLAELCRTLETKPRARGGSPSCSTGRTGRWRGALSALPGRTVTRLIWRGCSSGGLRISTQVSALRRSCWPPLSPKSWPPTNLAWKGARMPAPPIRQRWKH